MGRERVPSYRLHRSDGRAVVTIAGRDIYLGQHGTAESRAEYQRVLGEWLTHRVVPKPAQGGAQVTINELVLAYFQHAKVHYTKDGCPTSEVVLVRSALRWLRPAYGHTDARAFTPVALKAVRDAMVHAVRTKEPRKGKPRFCRNTINLHVGRIRRMFRWAVENGMVEGTIYQALLAVQGLQRGRTTARESGRVLPVSEEHVRAILPKVSRQVAAMIQLQELTGMRPGEVVTMRVCDLNTSESSWTYRPATHKTAHHGKTRTIAIGPRAQEIIRPFLKPDLGAYLFSPKDAVAERNAKLRAERTTPMTPSQAKRKPKDRPKKAPSDRYTTASYGRAIACACDAAEVPHWHPNQLRHSAATRLRRLYGIEATRVILGHSSMTTSEIYAEADEQKAAEVMAKVG